MKIHFNNALNPSKHHIPVCGAVHKRRLQTTSIPCNVTCERCRKMIDPYQPKEKTK